MNRTRTIWAACSVALLGLAGCSGGDDDNAASTTTVVPAGPTTAVLSTKTSFTGQNGAQLLRPGPHLQRAVQQGQR